MQQIRVLRPFVEPGPRQGQGAAGLDLTEIRPTGVEQLDLVVRERLARRRERRGQVTAGRRGQIEALFAEQAAALPRLMERTEAQTPTAMYAAALIAAVSTQQELSAGAAATLVALADLVTTPRPFLRWDPVIEPALVPRHRYTEAESLLTLVVRSGVEGPGEDGLTLTVVPPDVFATQSQAEHPELDLAWRADSQRHVAPPKTSQYEAELHGMFDAAIGSGDPGALTAALAMALRESGTFLDPTVADPTTPGVVAVAAARGIPHLRLNDRSLVMLGTGVHQKRIQATIASTTGAPRRRDRRRQGPHQEPARRPRRAGAEGRRRAGRGGRRRDRREARLARRRQAARRLARPRRADEHPERSRSCASPTRTPSSSATR